jgi:hypothetical protein
VAGFGSLYLATAATGGGHAFALTAGAMAAVALLAVIPAASPPAPPPPEAAGPLGGRAVQDIWKVPPSGDPAPGLRPFYGTTLRFYDPALVAVDLDRPAERPGPPVHRPPGRRQHRPRGPRRRPARALGLPRHHRQHFPLDRRNIPRRPPDLASGRADAPTPPTDVSWPCQRYRFRFDLEGAPVFHDPGPKRVIYARFGPGS